MQRAQEPSNSSPQSASWSLARTGLLSAAIVAGVQFLLLLTSNSGVLHGTLFDPDCYMHLQRALRMMTEGTWQALPDPRVNAPGGVMIHWTALFDILLVIGAWPSRLFGLDAHTALYLWGSAISPLLLMVALAVFAWGVRAWVRGAAFLWLTVLVFTQPQFSGAFLAGRPDHHSLVMALLLAQLAWLYALLDGRAGLRATIAAGVLAGLQICTSVEALLTIMMVALTLAVAWSVYRRDTLPALALYLGACAATIFFWLLCEGGFAAAYDRVSVVHLLALGTGALCFGALMVFRIGAQRRARVAAILGAGLLSCAVTAAFYPGFFLGPWPHLDAAVIAWHKTISELQPLLPTDGNHAAQFLAQFTAPLLGLPLILHRLFRRGCLYLLPSAIGFALFGAMALVQMRWSAELQAVTLLPWTLTTIEIMSSRLSLPLGKSRMPLRSVALTGALLLQMAPAAMAQGRAFSGPAHTNPACPWRSAIEMLPGHVPDRSIVLTEVWYGPEILWRTDLRAVGAPYEIGSALDDTDRFFNGSESVAHAIAVRRRLGYILVCAGDPHSGLGDRLTRGDHPSWLDPVSLPLPAFHLYRVSGL